MFYGLGQKRWWLLALLVVAFAAAPLAPDSVRRAAANPDRFGVIMTSGDTATARHVLQQLGMSWWWAFGAPATGAAGGKLVYVVKTPIPLKDRPPDRPNKDRLDLSELQTMVQNNPGAYWIIGNEVNTPGQDDVTPARYAELLDYYAATLKGIDSKAKLVGPNVLNWSETCPPGGCGGYTSGQEWTTQLIALYQQKGAALPLDVWGIHSYVIDWRQGADLSSVAARMANAQTAIDQVRGLRQYLNSLASEASKPIWITEFGVIWGYEGWEFREGKIAPTGAFRIDLLRAYLNQLGGWLNQNADDQRIERWFLYISYGLPEPYAAVFAGISLMTDGTTNALLTALGETYRNLAGVAPPPPSGGSGSGSGGSSAGSTTPSPGGDRGGPSGVPPQSTVPESRTATIAVATGGTVSAGSVQVQVPPEVVPGGGTITVQVEPLTAELAASQRGPQPLTMALRLPPPPEGQIMGSQLFAVRVLDSAGTPIAQLARPLTIVNQFSPEDVRRSGDRAEGLSLARFDATVWTALEGTVDLGTRQLTATTTRPGVLALLITIPPAQLQEPADGMFSVAMAPLLRWQVPTNAVWHQVQVLPANNDGPAINLIIGAPELVAAGQYQVPAPRFGVGNYILLPGMTYTWRVRMSTLTSPMSETSPGWSVWQARTFRTAPPTSATISAVSPAPGATVASLMPVLTWSNLNDRIFYYEVQLSQDPNFETDPSRAVAAVYWELVHGGESQPLNSYQVRSAFPLEPNSQYSWRVRPRVQGDGIPVDWSTTWTFRTP